ncbi:hypothetical protein [Actinokineospora sp. NPDC004072]
MIRRAVAASVLVLLAGCGVAPSEVMGGGRAPTGVAPGVVLYYLDARGDLVPHLVPTGRLGDVTAALELLLRGGGAPQDGLRSDLRPVESLGPQVTVSGTVTSVAVPLARHEVGERGIEQIVCTALGVNRQSGGPADMTVALTFTDGSGTGPLGCPLPA